MSKKVYIVTHGDYDEYRIRGVFSSLEKAEELQKHFSMPNEIEEWEIDEEITYPKDLLGYLVQFDWQGSPSVFRTDSESVREDIYKLPDEGLSLYVFARDEEHACEIAIDRRRVYLVGNPQKLNIDQTWEQNWKREQEEK